jgi:hypothetical protein
MEATRPVAATVTATATSGTHRHASRSPRDSGVAGALVPRPAPHELGESLSTVLPRLSPEKRERVELRLLDAPLAGDWQQTRVEQVLASPIGNALK